MTTIQSISGPLTVEEAQAWVNIMGISATARMRQIEGGEEALRAFLSQPQTQQSGAVVRSATRRSRTAPPRVRKKQPGPSLALPVPTPLTDPSEPEVADVPSAKPPAVTSEACRQVLAILKELGRPGSLSLVRSRIAGLGAAEVEATLVALCEQHHVCRVETRWALKGVV